MERFETQYPITAREKEIKQILSFVARGQSCQLISVPGAGRSTVLRLLTYNKKLLISNCLFVYLNFAEIPSFETLELNKSLFLAVLSSLEENPKLHEEVSSLFKEALKLNDSQVFFQNLKKSIEFLSVRGSIPIFLFDRFSEFADKIASDFFSNLRALRTASGGKLAVVFSTHRPLEELLPVEKWRDFYEFFLGNHIFLEMYDKVATDFRLSVLEKEYGQKLDPQVKEELVRLTGGHGKLMKLTTQIILATFPPQGSPAGHPWGVAKRFPRGERLIDFLLDHILIKGSLLEIWQATTPGEREKLTFPLFQEFVKRGIAESLVPKTIRLEEKTNEIYFGDEPIEGLTASEFKLLKFLIQNPNRVVEREEIIQAVWTETKTQAGVTDEALDQMVYRLRRKIEDEADNPQHLLTVKGRGFRFIP